VPNPREPFCRLLANKATTSDKGSRKPSLRAALSSIQWSVRIGGVCCLSVPTRKLLVLAHSCVSEIGYKCSDSIFTIRSNSNRTSTAGLSQIVRVVNCLGPQTSISPAQAKARITNRKVRLIRDLTRCLDRRDDNRQWAVEDVDLSSLNQVSGSVGFVGQGKGKAKEANVNHNLVKTARLGGFGRMRQGMLS